MGRSCIWSQTFRPLVWLVLMNKEIFNHYKTSKYANGLTLDSNPEKSFLPFWSMNWNDTNITYACAMLLYIISFRGQVPSR
jgi:hypothetical protein